MIDKQDLDDIIIGKKKIDIGYADSKQGRLKV